MLRDNVKVACLAICGLIVACGDDDDDTEMDMTTTQLSATDQALCGALEGTARSTATAAAPSAQFTPGATLPALNADATAYTLTLPMDEMGGSTFEGFAEIVVQEDGEYVVAIGGEATLIVIPRPMGPPTPSMPTETLSGSDSPCPDSVNQRLTYSLSASASQGVHYFQFESASSTIDVSVLRTN
ncbi:MAG: hypothetical protein AAF654_08640 [Myxococcota bacterium]